MRHRECEAWNKFNRVDYQFVSRPVQVPTCASASKSDSTSTSADEAENEDKERASSPKKSRRMSTGSRHQE